MRLSRLRPAEQPNSPWCSYARIDAPYFVQRVLVLELRAIDVRCGRCPQTDPCATATADGDIHITCQVQRP
jgi:hypothetical protein